MLLSVLGLGAAAFLLCCSRVRRERPLDDQEMFIIRRFSDAYRREQIHPFE